jgi:hypothetical protein
VDDPPCKAATRFLHHLSKPADSMNQFVPKPFSVHNAIIAALLTVLIISLMLPACKKDKTPSVTEKLMHKWSLVQTNDTLYTPTASPVISSYTGTSTDYMDFRTDGKLYSFINNKYDTANYTYSELNFKLNVRSYRYNILILTDQSMVIHEPHITSSTVGHSASKITLKR